MKKDIVYRITYANGKTDEVIANVRTINNGFRDIAPALMMTGPEISKIEFWKVLRSPRVK